MFKRFVPFLLIAALLGGCNIEVIPSDEPSDQGPSEGDGEPHDDGHPEDGGSGPTENKIELLGDLTGNYQGGNELSHSKNVDGFIAYLNRNESGLIINPSFTVLFAQQDGSGQVLTTIGSAKNNGSFRIGFSKRVIRYEVTLSSFWKHYVDAGVTKNNTYTCNYSFDAGGEVKTGQLTPNEDATANVPVKFDGFMGDSDYIEIKGLEQTGGANDYRVVIHSLSVFLQ